MKKIHYIYLFFISLILSSCVGDVDDVFDSPAPLRMEATLAEYREILTSSEHGWFADFYPGEKYGSGGYAMHLMFNSAGEVTICSEKKTNLPKFEKATSEWSLISYQGPFLSFLTYNPVMHYFSEPTPTNIYGQRSDYEFTVLNATNDSLELIGKKYKNKLLLRRNTQKVDPQAYFEDLLKMEYDLSEFAMFSLNVNDVQIGSCAVVNRTFSLEYMDEEGVEKTKTVHYTFTPEGIRLAIPLEFSGVEMQTFIWNKEKERYICCDSGVNAYFEPFFPDDFELRYTEIIGKWEFKYHGSASATEFIEEIVEIKEDKKNSSFLMTSDKLFSFKGIKLSFDAQKGRIYIRNHSADIIGETGQEIRAIAGYSRKAGLGYMTIGHSVGLDGKWNQDKDGIRKIEFVDNGKWANNKADGILLRLYPNGTKDDNYTANIAGHIFSDITITKISD